MIYNLKFIDGERGVVVGGVNRPDATATADDEASSK